LDGGVPGLFSIQLSLFFCAILCVLDGADSILWTSSRCDFRYFKHTFFFAACQLGLVVAHSIWLVPIWLEPLNVFLYGIFLVIWSRSFFKKQLLHGAAIAGVAICTVRYIVNHQLIAGQSPFVHGAIIGGFIGLGLTGFILSDDESVIAWYILGAAAGAFLFYEGIGTLTEIVFCNLVWFQICIMHVWITCRWFYLAQVNERKFDCK
jgi:hypothetical protein